MPNSVTAKKEYRKMLKRRNVNKSRKNKIKTFIKNFNRAIESGDKELSVSYFKAVEPQIQKSIGKRIFKKNKAANMVSSLSKKLKELCLKKQA